MSRKTKDSDTKKAIALQYLSDQDAAPRIVATGRGTIAEHILELAFEKGVKVREDSFLADLLSDVDLGDEIPLEAFEAVAEILAYLYKENGRLSQTKAMTNADGTLNL